MSLCEIGSQEIDLHVTADFRLYHWLEGQLMVC